MEDLELKNIRTQKEKTFIDSPFEVKLTFITDKNEPEYLSKVQISLYGPHSGEYILNCTGDAAKMLSGTLNKIFKNS